MQFCHLFEFFTILLIVSEPTMTSSSTKDALAAFPYPKLTPIATSASGPPTYASIKLAQTELNGNAASVPSTGGDGILGHLALTVTPAQYNLRSAGNVAFIAPVQPPQVPNHGNNPTAFTIAEDNRLHKEAHARFRTYHDVDKALRNQLIAAVHPTYLSKLNDDMLGLGSRTCLELLTHLWTHYGAIKQDELEANTKKMMLPWNPPTPIEDLFTQLEDGVKFAVAGGEEPSAQAVVRMGYTIIEATGLFPVDCRAWRDKDAALKTMDHFQTHFEKADVDRRRTMTSASAGFQGAANNATEAAAAAVIVSTVPLSYCWTHGSSKNTAHTSATCLNKAEGHVDDATIKNKKGGSDKVWGPKK